MVSNTTHNPASQAVGGLVGHVRARANARSHFTALVGNSTCQHARLTYAELFRAVDEVAAGFMALGIRPGDHIGLVADNHDLWLLADLGLLSIGAVDVPRGADASPTEIALCLGHAGCSTAIFADSALHDRCRDLLPAIHRVIVLRGDPPPNGMTFAELRALGTTFMATREGELRARQSAVRDDDLATIIFTSGTTGNPKGVMLTHGNFLHNVRAVPTVLHFDPGMRFVSVLPSWHSFERTIEYVVLDCGLELHYSSKRAFRQDVAAVKPEFVVGVPRIFELFYQGVIGAIEKLPPSKRRLVDWALAGSVTFHALGRRRRGLSLTAPARVVRPAALERLGLGLGQLVSLIPELVARRLVYRKMRAAFGGNLQISISGGGPLPSGIDEFLVRCGIPFLNGYGLTETAPVVCVRVPARNLLGTIGKPLPETEVRIVDDAGRDVGREVRGIIQVRGPQVMQGYWNNDVATRACLSSDRWFDTGDTGMLTNEGDIVITGRAKDTIVLTGGENVEPENIETALLMSPVFAEVIVVGHAQKALGALVLPNIEILRARDRNIPEGPLEVVARHPLVERAVRVEISRLIAPERGFRTFELIARVATITRPFTSDDGTLTGSLKKRRRQIEDRHADDIARLFA